MELSHEPRVTYRDVDAEVALLQVGELGAHLPHRDTACERHPQREALERARQELEQVECHALRLFVVQIRKRELLQVRQCKRRLGELQEEVPDGEGLEVRERVAQHIEVEAVRARSSGWRVKRQVLEVWTPHGDEWRVVESVLGVPREAQPLQLCEGLGGVLEYLRREAHVVWCVSYTGASLWQTRASEEKNVMVSQRRGAERTSS